MKRFTLGGPVAIPLILFAGQLSGQEVNHPMYLVYQEYVRAAQTPQYEEATHTLLDRMLETPISSQVQFVTIAGPELGYAFVVPIDGFAGIDAFNRNLAAGAGHIGLDEWTGLEDKIGQAIDHRKSIVIELRPDLSYLPDLVDLTAELPFRNYHWYYTIPGKQQQLESVALELVALYAANGIGHGFRFYQILLGDDLPGYVVVERAESEADYAARTAKIRETVGGDADALLGKALAFTRRIEVMEGLIRPDLSFPPVDVHPRD
jgi:hypothetical protein